MSPEDLDNVLCGLNVPSDPNLIVGMETGEDAGVYRLNDETALIQTVDFFTPIVDDPFLFGQIAAANALSDVYAMGGKPLLAMNLACFPIKKMDKEVLKDIFRGGLEKIKEAGALLVGGHTIEDEELKYGLSVTGVAHPNRILLNSGARPGDQLLLTKPLGTGILSTAIKGGLAGKEIENMISLVMATLNRDAAQIMNSVQPHGCTDITGFGLIGHLHEVAVASGVGIKIKASAIPVLPEVKHFVSLGIIPEGAYKNRNFYQKKVKSLLMASDPLEMILYDPQTSGGLLISAKPDEVASIATRLRKRNYALDYGVIGEVVEGHPGTIFVEP